MFNPLKYYTGEAIKNLNDKAKEILSFMYPPVTIYEEGGDIVIDADLPGFDKKDVKVRAEKDAVTIEASRKIEPKTGTLISNQRPEKIFKRIKIPYETDTSTDLSAKYQNGILTIRIPAKGFKTIKVE